MSGSGSWRHHPGEVRRRLHVAAIDGPEERREALRVHVVDVRLGVHQRGGEVVVAVEDRQAQRVLAVAGNRVHVRAGGHQQAGRLQVALAGGQHQRRQPAAGELLHLPAGVVRDRRPALEAAAVGGRHEVRARLHVGAVLQQQLHRLGVALRHGPHQRGGAAPLLLLVDPGARFEQHLQRVGPPGARRHHHGRVAELRQRRVGIGAGLHQLVQHGGVAVHRRQLQRPHAGAIGRRDVGAGADQHVGHVGVVEADRPVQRRRAVHLRRVDVGLSLQQRTDRAAVALHRGVRHLTAGRPGAGRGHQHHHTASERASHRHRLAPTNV